MADPSFLSPLPRQPWHSRDVDRVAAMLDTSVSQGLESGVAERRLAQGRNEIAEAPPRPAWLVFLDQFRDFMIGMLLVAAALSAAIGEITDSLVIAAILVLNALIGAAQELRAERAVRSLKKFAAVNAKVLRGGAVLYQDASELVPGDVVLVEAGDLVPADLRLFETAAFRMNESTLTGESVEVDKFSHAIAEPELTLGDRRNMAFRGTFASHGRARGLVVATGMNTELGRIAAYLGAGERDKTPLQERLAGFGRRLALMALSICALVFIHGLLRGEPLVLMFMTAVSLAVAAVPEALPAVVTVALALGAARMVRHQALARRLPAVETLGSVSVICSDKTGTLTQNRMWVESLYAPDGERIVTGKPGDGSLPLRLFQAMALNNDARGESPQAEPTEAALLAAARAAGMDKAAIERELPRVAEIPFDSSRKMMTTVHRSAEGWVAYTKGAPERVLPRCIRLLRGGEPDGFGPVEPMLLAERMAAEGMRVIAYARRQWPRLPDTDDSDGTETELEFLGLVGLIDPPRPEAAEAVALCAGAGITPVMITGDHPATAANIAVRLGIARAGARVINGIELARMGDAELAECAREVRVYARVDPEQKIRIVEALQRNGLCVAMTGDGVNDAPALKRADIGVAMGRSGTDVAREAADMVLLDDNFATIVRAVSEGRRIYDNIRRFVRFVMGGNTGEILTIFAAPFLGLPLPLLPIHLLWVNLLTDGLPGLALAAEPASPDVMRRPPRPRGESLFAHGLWQQVVWVGLLIAVLTLSVQAWGFAQGNSHWQTMAFTVLTFAQLAQSLAVRSERDSLFAIGVSSNPALLGAVALTALLQLAVIYLPAANTIFKTQPLTGFELALCISAGLAVLLAVEFEKWLIRRSGIYGIPRSEIAA